MPKQKEKNLEREKQGTERLADKRGPDAEPKVGVVKIVALQDFNGAGMDMIAGGTYTVPADKGKFWINAGLAQAKDKPAPKSKDVKGPEVSK